MLPYNVTIQQIKNVFTVFPKKVKPEYNYVICFVFIALFIAFFPKIDFQKTNQPDLGNCPYVITYKRIFEDIRKTCPASKLINESVRINENASLNYDLEIPFSEKNELFIIAKGSPCGNKYPYLSVKIDRKPYSGFFVSGEEWGAYIVPFKLKKGRHNFEFSYINNELQFPYDMHLDIKCISAGITPPNIDNYYRFKAPLSITPDKMCFQYFGEQKMFYYRIWNKGYLADDIYFDQAVQDKIYIKASKPAGKNRSFLILKVNGINKARFI